MELIIQSIHFDADQKLKDYIQKKCNKFDRYFDRIVDGQVYLRVTQPQAANNKWVEIKVNVPGNVLLASEEADTFEVATDLVVGKLTEQIRRYKDRLKSHQ